MEQPEATMRTKSGFSPDEWVFRPVILGIGNEGTIAGNKLRDIDLGLDLAVRKRTTFLNPSRSPKTEPQMYNRILLPTDGSNLAAKGVDHGLALAHALNVPVTVVTVTVPLTGFAFQGIVQAESIDSYNEGVQKEVADLEKLVRDKAADKGVTVDFVNETNHSPASAILDVAQAKGCDLIVISSHGRRGISRLMLGSQTAEVVANSAVPVLIVR